MKKSTNLIWVASLSLALSACGQNANFSRGAARPAVGSDQDTQVIAGQNNEANVRGASDGSDANAGEGNGSDSAEVAGTESGSNPVAGDGSGNDNGAARAAVGNGARAVGDSIADGSGAGTPAVASGAGAPESQASVTPSSVALVDGASSETPIAAADGTATPASNAAPVVTATTPAYQGGASDAALTYGEQNSPSNRDLPGSKFKLVAVSTAEKSALLAKLPYLKSNGNPLNKSKITNPSRQLQNNKFVVFKASDLRFEFTKNQIVKIDGLDLIFRSKVSRAQQEQQMFCIFKPGKHLVCSGKKLAGTWATEGRRARVKLNDLSLGNNEQNKVIGVAGLQDGVDNEYFANVYIPGSFADAPNRATRSTTQAKELDLIKSMSQPRRTDKVDVRDLLFVNSEANESDTLKNEPVYFIVGANFGVMTERESTEEAVLKVSLTYDRARPAQSDEELLRAERNAAAVGSIPAAAVQPSAPVVPTTPAQAIPLPLTLGPTGSAASNLTPEEADLQALLNAMAAGQPFVAPAAN